MGGKDRRVSDLVEEIAKVRRKLLALERELDELTAPYHPPRSLLPIVRAWIGSAILGAVGQVGLSR